MTTDLNAINTARPALEKALENANKQAKYIDRRGKKLEKALDEAIEREEQRQIYPTLPVINPPSQPTDPPLEVKASPSNEPPIPLCSQHL